jgi:hypothetical protein
MRGLLTAAYNILPDFAALVLAAFGVAALFLTDLFDKLKPWNKTRWALAIVIGLFGFGALLSNNDQKLQEKTRSDAERGELTGQINQLLATAQIQATHDDVTRLGLSLSSGLDRIAGQFRSNSRQPPVRVGTGAAKEETDVSSGSGSMGDSRNLQVHPATADSNLTADSFITTDAGAYLTTENGARIIALPAVKLDASLIGNVQMIQQPAPSNNPQLPYALQVIVQTEQHTFPVSFAFGCTGPIGGMTYFVAGQLSTSFTDLVANAGQGKSTAVLRFSSPVMTPNTPLVVTLYSKTEIRVLQLRAGTT